MLRTGRFAGAAFNTFILALPAGIDHVELLLIKSPLHITEKLYNIQTGKSTGNADVHRAYLRTIITAGTRHDGNSFYGLPGFCFCRLLRLV